MYAYWRLTEHVPAMISKFHCQIIHLVATEGLPCLETMQMFDEVVMVLYGSELNLAMAA